MDFKDQIRQKYQKEIQPSYNEERWKQFVAHREARKRPRRRWALYLILLMLLLAIGLVGIDKFASQNQGTQNKLSYVDASAIADNVSDFQASVPGDQQVEVNSHSTAPEVDINVVALPNAFIPEMTSPISSHQESDNAGVVLVPSSVGNDSRIELTFVEISSRKATPLNFKRNLRNVDHANHGILGDPSIRVSGLVAWPKYLHTIQVYGGLTYPSHVETVEEQAHQFGSTIHRRLSNRLRAKLNLHFASVNFTTQSMNPRLGVDYVESPSDLVQFDHSIVESINSNLNLGLDYLFWKTGDFYAYGGVGYGLSKELVKDIDYIFNGQDDLDIKDDVYLSKSDAKKYFIPHVVRLETGVQYQNELGGILFSLEYPIQLSTTRIEMFRQWQVNFGLLRQL